MLSSRGSGCKSTHFFVDTGRVALWEFFLLKIINDIPSLCLRREFFLVLGVSQDWEPSFLPFLSFPRIGKACFYLFEAFPKLGATLTL